MQIDFHYSVIYIIARLAGFEADEAGIVAYASQSVDDAVCNDTVWFDNGAIYKPICSAHKGLDYKNFDELADHLVWVPFHFLPGNNMSSQHSYNDSDFVSRIICRPNSFIARDMVTECIKHKGEQNSLHRLGITLHVFADTWAHQGFAGISNDVNRVGYIVDSEEGKNLFEKVKHYFTDAFDTNLSQFIDTVEPLGHGPALSYPDLPFLKWSYIDYAGKKIIRDNNEIFIEAVRNIYKVMLCYRDQNIDSSNSELEDRYVNKFAELFEKFKDDDGNKRNMEWLEVISSGEFGFGKEYPEYKTEGIGSWEYAAFGGCRPDAHTCTKFTKEFIDSDWKKFNDALIDHQHFMIRKLLPSYGLCIA